MAINVYATSLPTTSSTEILSITSDVTAAEIFIGKCTLNPDYKDI